MSRRVDREFGPFEVWPRQGQEHDVLDVCGFARFCENRDGANGHAAAHRMPMAHLRERPALPGREDADAAVANPQALSTVYAAVAAVLKHGMPVRGTATQRADLVSLLLLPAFARLQRAPLTYVGLDLPTVVAFLDDAMERRDLRAVGAMLSLHPPWFFDVDAMLAVLVASLPTFRVKTLRARRAAFAKRAAGSLAEAGWSDAEIREGMALCVLPDGEEMECAT